MTITASRKIPSKSCRAKKMRGGDSPQEMVIDTEDGMKAADVTWMSDTFLKANKGRSSFRHARKSA